MRRERGWQRETGPLPGVSSWVYLSYVLLEGSVLIVGWLGISHVNSLSSCIGRHTPCMSSAHTYPASWTVRMPGNKATYPASCVLLQCMVGFCPNKTVIVCPQGKTLSQIFSCLHTHTELIQEFEFFSKHELDHEDKTENAVVSSSLFPSLALRLLSSPFFFLLFSLLPSPSPPSPLSSFPPAQFH